MNINKSNLVHTAFAVGFQIPLGLLTGNFCYGAVLAIGFFLGREHAQRQYNIAKEKKVTVKDLKPWEGFDIIKWSEDSTFDWLLPTVVSSIVAYTLHTFFL